jgi:hypothetical protein
MHRASFGDCVLKLPSTKALEWLMQELKEKDDSPALTHSIIAVLAHALARQFVNRLFSSAPLLAVSIIGGISWSLCFAYAATKNYEVIHTGARLVHRRHSLSAGLLESLRLLAVSTFRGLAILRDSCFMHMAIKNHGAIHQAHRTDHEQVIWEAPMCFIMNANEFMKARYKEQFFAVANPKCG